MHRARPDDHGQTLMTCHQLLSGPSRSGPHAGWRVSSFWKTPQVASHRLPCCGGIVPRTQPCRPAGSGCGRPILFSTKQQQGPAISVQNQIAARKRTRPASPTRCGSDASRPATTSATATLRVFWTSHLLSEPPNFHQQPRSFKSLSLTGRLQPGVPE